MATTVQEWPKRKGIHSCRKRKLQPTVMPSHGTEILGGYDVSTLMAPELSCLEGLQQVQTLEKGTDFSSKYSLHNFFHSMITYYLHNTFLDGVLQFCKPGKPGEARDRRDVFRCGLVLEEVASGERKNAVASDEWRVASLRPNQRKW